ncbi:hypothetical protein LCGC14_1117340 [marine sediment metagenome]|uniref:Uncharacterized protein n=1 Tax=marine sediment metagenome TaxID=412755 RepID=A0A0F9MST1_9ZZZZ
MDLDFKYTTDAERVQACHEREERLSAMTCNLDLIAAIHEKIKRFRLLSAQDYNILDHVLDWIITDILHQQAETEYIERTFGVKDEKTQ